MLKKFMRKAAIKYEIGMTDLVYKPSHSLFEFINLQVLKGLFHLNIFTNFRSYVRKYFKDSRLIRLMEFPVLFLGATPQNTPALYSLMNYTGLYQGTYYPIGGFNEVIQGLVALANEKELKLKRIVMFRKLSLKIQKLMGLGLTILFICSMQLLQVLTTIMLNKTCYPKT